MQVTEENEVSCFQISNITAEIHEKKVIAPKAQISLCDNRNFYTFQLPATQKFTSL